MRRYYIPRSNFGFPAGLNRPRLRRLTSLRRGFCLGCLLLTFAFVGSAVETGIEDSVNKPIKDLNAIAQLVSGFERDASIYTLVMNSNEKELYSILEQTHKITRKGLRASMQSIVIQRFASIDPKKALSHVNSLPENIHHSLVVEIFREWSQHEFDAAISHGQSLSDSRKLAAVQGILRARDDLSEDLQREIARSTGLGGHSINLIVQSSIYGPIESPKDAWQSILG